jgi:hypothetical protein
MSWGSRSCLLRYRDAKTRNTAESIVGVLQVSSGYDSDDRAPWEEEEWSPRADRSGMGMFPFPAQEDPWESYKTEKVGSLMMALANLEREADKVRH